MRFDNNRRLTSMGPLYWNQFFCISQHSKWLQNINIYISSATNLMLNSAAIFSIFIKKGNQKSFYLWKPGFGFFTSFYYLLYSFPDIKQNKFILFWFTLFFFTLLSFYVYSFVCINRIFHQKQTLQICFIFFKESKSCF